MKRTLCLLLVFATFGLCAQNAEVRHQMRLSAPSRMANDISPNDIQFWVGQGANEVVVSFFACGPSPAGGWAYGYRFNGSSSIQEMLDDIQNADPNFNINISGSLVDDYSYNNETLNYYVGGGMLTYTINGTWASGLSDMLADGDQFVMSEYGDCGIPNANIYYPTDPNAPDAPEDASINVDDVSYWVGAGERSAILVVNWCDTDIALAWGVRFSGDSITIADMMNTVRIYDPRFSFAGYDGMVSEIAFHDDTYNLSMNNSWWMYTLNGSVSWNAFTQQNIGHGDVVKWGDIACGITDESYNYVWTTPVQPVHLPTVQAEPFDGIVGSDGCQAISYDNPNIRGWASSCTVTRGPQDIASPTILASYGNETAAIGPSSLSTIDAVSLGDGGIAVLTFDQPISDGEGYDFAVFENALNDIFLELAFVEVSSDGIHYYRFPATSFAPIDQQVGNGGNVDARLLHNLAGKYRVGWGVPFDLAELAGYSNLDLNNITHVRIVDVVGSIDPQYGTTDRNGRIINDPYPTDFESCGFDLSGVAILNGWTPYSINEHHVENTPHAYPNPCNNVLYIDNLVNGEKVMLYDIAGQLLWCENSNGNRIFIPMQDLPNGIYFVKSGTGTCKVVKR